MDDLISRQAAIDAIMNEVEPFAIVEPGTTCVIGIGVNNKDVVRVLEQMPTADPSTAQTTGEKARTTDDWIPVEWHYCTDAERDEYGFGKDIAVVLDCEMPNDEQEILVTTSHGYVEKDVCYIDDGYSLDSGYDWLEDIKAWKPLPEPYRGGDE